jgi:hypothetical protein
MHNCMYMLCARRCCCRWRQNVSDYVCKQLQVRGTQQAEEKGHDGDIQIVTWTSNLLSVITSSTHVHNDCMHKHRHVTCALLAWH